MIDLINNKIVFKGQEHPILKWEVWYMTPGGLAESLEEASKYTRSLDFDPAITIIPVPVAVAAEIYEVYAR